jgi:tripartite ATP-independent transporter DctP family solute receptor
MGRDYNPRVKVTRRTFVAGLGSATALVGTARLDEAAQQRSRAEFTFSQYHNQIADSPLHRSLVWMWDEIRTDTGGRVDTRVFAQNNNIPGSDPQALRMLVAGEIEFFTLMGGVLDSVVPSTAVQDMPFAFRSAEHAHAVMDGPLGAYLRAEMDAHGIHGFPVGSFDNGMRQISIIPHPVVVPGDLIGIRMRTPAAPLIADTFRAFGAEPVTVNSADIYAALKNGTVDAQENPLALIELFKLYEVARYISVTDHIWSGFNELAHLGTWKRLPDDIKAIIDRNVARHVRLQRQQQSAFNTRLRTTLASQGPVFNDVDQAPFRRMLGAVYAKWKAELGATCWTLLEQATGSLS